MRFLNGIDKLRSFILCIIHSKPYFFKKFSSMNKKKDFYVYVSEYNCYAPAAMLKYEFLTE